MNQSQIQLQNALTTTFLANLVFLSEYDNELYHRVDELSRMIENGSYKEKYALEFIMESGDFDIYDIINNKYLYEKEPKKINDELIKKVKFDQTNSIFYVPEYFTFRNKVELDLENRFYYEYMEEFIALTQNDMVTYASLLNDFVHNNKKKLKEIKKFIFLGTLLGRHIPKIAEKVDADVYLVLERNLEIFRLSLFTVDYTILARKNVIFSIMDNNAEEEIRITKFINIGYLENYLLKFSTTNINISKYVDSLLASLLLETPSQYDYNRQLYCHINRTTKVLDSNYKTILLNKIKEKFNIFENLPVLYLAGGPSLDENITWIKENQNKFFIVTIGAAYKKLLLNDIKIDIISTLDESVTFDKIQFDDESVKKISEKTIILASTITNERVLKKFNQNNLFLYEVLINYHKNNIALGGYSVGELTLNIILNMNAKNVYLIGLDLALNQNTGLSHSKDASTGVYSINLDMEQNRETFHNKKNTIKVKGNLQQEVFTTSLLYNSIRYLDNMITEDSKVNIYNLSIHGAYLSNTIPTRIENLKINDFDKIDCIYSDLLLLLKNNSRNNLSSESKYLINKEILFIQERLKKDLLEIQNSDFKNFEEFSDRILVLAKLIQEQEFDFFSISSLIHNYYAMIISYLFYHFNDTSIEKIEKKEILKIKKIFIKQMENIFEDCIVCLQRVSK